MPDQATPTYIGLDISKARLDYTVDDQRTADVSNNPKGHQALIGWLKQQPNPRVVCEATGGYERAVVAALLEAGREVCVVQPGRARAFAEAEGLMAKTDRLDALLLRRYGKAVVLRLAKAPDPLTVELRALLDRRRDLIERRVEIDNQLGTAVPTLAKLLEREQRFLRKEIAYIEQAIAQLIDSHPALKQKHQRMQQLQGCGPVLATTLLAYLPELGEVSDATASALLGVAPYAKDSGKSGKPRHVRGGRGTPRHVLYMAAVSASQSNPVLAHFYQRLLAAGKPPMVCLVAVMRKIVVVLNRLLADPQFTLAG